MRFPALRRVALLGCLVLLVPPRVQSQEARLDARNWQLFLDDYAIARGTGFDRVVHHPKSLGVVIAGDRPWETNAVQPIYFARQPDGTFIGFYNAVWSAPNTGARSSNLSDMVYADGAWRAAKFDPKRAPDRAQDYVNSVAYATSRDGIHWEKPNLGLVEAPTGVDREKYAPFPYPTGHSKANNLGVQFRINDLGQYGNVTDPARRYAVYTGGRAYFSPTIPDFIHDPDWRSKLTDAGGIFSPRGHSLDFWDSVHGEWVAIVQNATTHWLPSRTVARFASSDLKTWHSEMALTPDLADSHTPTCYDEPMMLTPFYTEGIAFGLLSWVHTDRTTPDGGPVMEAAEVAPQGWPWPLTARNPVVWPWARKGVNEMRITISRDGGHTWDRTSSREAWIPHGTEQDSYDRLVIVASPPVRVGDEDWFYMGDDNGDHLTHRANAQQNLYYHDRERHGTVVLYTQKHDRYVSVGTGTQIETLITKPFVVEGDTLELNVDASRGQVRVGIAGYKPVPTLGSVLGQGTPAGTTLTTDPYVMEQNILPDFTRGDCVPLEVNSIAAPVAFKSGTSLKSLHGRTVVLFIEMLDADLYGFRVH